MWTLFDWTHQGTLLGTARTFAMEYEQPIVRVSTVNPSLKTTTPHLPKGLIEASDAQSYSGVTGVGIRYRLVLAFHYVFNTVEPILKDHTIGHKNMVSNRWSLLTGSIALKCRTSARTSLSRYGSGLSRQISLRSTVVNLLLHKWSNSGEVLFLIGS